MPCRLRAGVPILRPIHVIELPGPQGAPLVVMVHGGRDRSGSFRPVANLLDDFRVVLYDRRGYGESPVPERPLRFEDHVDDLLWVLGEREATVIGHSWGGHVALATAVRRPDLVRSVGVFETAWMWMEWWSQENKDAIHRFADRGWPEATPAQLVRMRGEVTMIEHAPYDVFALRVPCVIAYGPGARPSERESFIRAGETIGTDAVALGVSSHIAHRSDPEVFAEFVRHVVALAKR
jgi:pimeloyl-ACP methyl ester carboxylesterase